MFFHESLSRPSRFPRIGRSSRWAANFIISFCRLESRVARVAIRFGTSQSWKDSVSLRARRSWPHEAISLVEKKGDCPRGHPRAKARMPKGGTAEGLVPGSHRHVPPRRNPSTPLRTSFADRSRRMRTRQRRILRLRGTGIDKTPDAAPLRMLQRMRNVSEYVIELGHAR